MVPVFPNSIVIMVEGFTKMNCKKFAIVSSLGIFGLTFPFGMISYDIMGLIRHPIKLMMLILILKSASMIGRIFERKYKLNRLL